MIRSDLGRDHLVLEQEIGSRVKTHRWIDEKKSDRPSHPILRWVYALWMVLFLFAPARAERTDVVVLRNGDHITGEIKELKLGKLKYSTDDAGTIFIEWDKVAFIRSKDTFELETAIGAEYFGSVDSDTINVAVLVLSGTDTVRLRFPDVVRITPIKSSFWTRLDGSSASLGFNYGKAGKVGRLNFNGDIRHRTRRVSSNLALNSILTFQEDKETSKRNSASTGIIRFFPGWWLAGGSLTLEQNSELGIDFRILAGGGGGRFLIQTNSSHLRVLAGFQFNQEWVTDAAESQANLESFGNVNFLTYRFDSPKLDFSTDFTIYPNLTPVGRVRAEFKIDLQWELVKDFFWNLEFYDSFDSEPPSEDASKNDFGIVVSFGWTY